MATISKLPSGKFRVQIRRAGIYRNRTFSRKADARNWGVEMEQAIEGGSNAGTIRAPGGMTLGDVIAAYMEDVNIGRTGRSNLERISARIGSTGINRLSALTISEFVDGRLKEGAGGSTIAGDLSSLSSVLKWARAVRSIDVNTQLAAEARRNMTARRIDTRSAERVRIPTQSELDRILDHIESNLLQRLPAATVIRFAAASAMRLGEICRIRIEDIAWNEKTVLIRERKDPKRKARNDQVVPLVGAAYDIARAVAGDRTEGRLFPYNERSVGAVFARTTSKLGIVDLHFHDLRHLAITELFRAGLPIQLVAIVSGHRDWKNLKRYTQLGAQDVHAALEALK